MRSIFAVRVVIPLAVIALVICIYRFSGAQTQTSASASGHSLNQVGRYQLLSGREQWYERNVPVVHEAVLMLDTETGQAWHLSDIYGAKKWEPINPPKTSE